MQMIQCREWKEKDNHVYLDEKESKEIIDKIKKAIVLEKEDSKNENKEIWISGRWSKWVECMAEDKDFAFECLKAAVVDNIKFSDDGGNNKLYSLLSSFVVWNDNKDEVCFNDDYQKTMNELYKIFIDQKPKNIQEVIRIFEQFDYIKEDTINFLKEKDYEGIVWNKIDDFIDYDAIAACFDIYDENTKQECKEDYYFDANDFEIERDVYKNKNCFILEENDDFICYLQKQWNHDTDSTEVVFKNILLDVWPEGATYENLICQEVAVWNIEEIEEMLSSSDRSLTDEARLKDEEFKKAMSEYFCEFGTSSFFELNMEKDLPVGAFDVERWCKQNIVNEKSNNQK